MFARLADVGRRQRWLRSAVLHGRNVRAGAMDRWLNIHTVAHEVHPRAGLEHAVDAYPYEPIHYPLAMRFLRMLNVGADDVVYDLGCGLGRFVCLAARTGARRSVGVEISDVFANGARRNALSLRGRGPGCDVEIILDDAASVEYDDGTVFLLFNPFGEQTMRAVLHKIERSLIHNPRNIRIGYGNPMHEELLEECTWLERYDEYRSMWYERPSSFWRLSPDAIAAWKSSAPEQQFVFGAVA